MHFTHANVCLSMYFSFFLDISFAGISQFQRSPEKGLPRVLRRRHGGQHHEQENLTRQFISEEIEKSGERCAGGGVQKG